MHNLKPALYLRYLLSVCALLEDTEYGDIIELSREFETSIAPRLQRNLNLKCLWSDNYVSNWWEEFVYLRGRSPIMINSNYYPWTRYTRTRQETR
jgi:carnitine O-palmitoyltransferase 1